MHLVGQARPACGREDPIRCSRGDRGMSRTGQSPVGRNSLLKRRRPNESTIGLFGAARLGWCSRTVLPNVAMRGGCVWRLVPGVCAYTQTSSPLHHSFISLRTPFAPHSSFHHSFRIFFFFPCFLRAI